MEKQRGGLRGASHSALWTLPQVALRVRYRGVRGKGGSEGRRVSLERDLHVNVANNE